MRKYYKKRKRNDNDEVNKNNNNRHNYHYLTTTTNKIYTCNSTQYVWNMNNTIVSHDNKKILFR